MAERRAGKPEDEGQQRQERFRAVYEAVRPRLAAYALRRTSSPEDAADVAAETFAIAWRRLDDVPEGDDSVLWFYATARRVLANHYRRARRHSELVRRIGSHLNAALVTEEAVDAERVAALAALRLLDDDDRELLLLATWEGLGSAELSRLLNCSSTAVRLRLHRARARLAREMETLGLAEKQTQTSRQLLLHAPAPANEAEGQRS